MLGKIEGKGRRKRQSMRWLDSIIDSKGMNVSELQEIVKDKPDCKDGCSKGQKWYGPNRSRRY